MNKLFRHWQALPLVGLQWIHGFFFVGFGSALLANTGGSGTTLQLARVIPPYFYGDFLIITGLLFFVVKFERVLWLLCGGFLPYMVAAIAFYMASGSLQAMTILIPFQAFLFIGVYAESERRRKTGGIK